MNLLKEKNRKSWIILIIPGIIFYLFSFINITDCDAQARQYQWVRNAGGNGLDQANCVINTAGNIWKGGKVSSAAEFIRPDKTALPNLNAGAYVSHYLNVKAVGAATYY